VNLLLGQILNGIATGMLYALMGLGLSLITGVLNIPNFAHGALFAIGAYLLVSAVNLIGNFWIGLLIAPLGVAMLGLLIEYAGIRRLYAAGHDYQLLFTFGLALILNEMIIVIWGPVGISQLPPAILRGGVDLGFTFYPKYRLFVMAMAGLLVFATWLFLEKTRYGAIMRAGIENKEMVSLLGIDIHWLFTIAFALGAYLAGIAGADPRPFARHGRGHARHRLRRGGARRAGQPARRDRGGPAHRHRAGRGRRVLDRSLHRGDLRGDGAGAAHPSAGDVRHPMRALVLILISICVLPFIVRPAIATEIWIFAIFGLGLNLLLGYTGLLSFGQSTFFGSAAYVAGWLLKNYGINVFFALGIGVGVGALSALLVGYLCVQRSGLYYAFVSVLFLLSLWLMKRVVESPLGKVLQAIRENEVRAEAVGYHVPRFKLLAFVIGGAFSGLAGVLYAMLFGIVPLEAISFVFSGNVVFATLIGGSGSLYGPIIGSFVFIWLSESVSTLWARWPLLLGLAFVVVVLFLRGGVVEAWSKIGARFRSWQSSKPGN